MKTLFTYLILSLLGLTTLFAQAPEPYVISPVVGAELNEDEFFKYRFDEWVKIRPSEVETAVLYEGETTFKMIVYTKNGQELTARVPEVFIQKVQADIRKDKKQLLKTWYLLKVSMEKGEPFYMWLKEEGEIYVQGEVMANTEDGFIFRYEEVDRLVLLENVIGMHTVFPELEKERLEDFAAYSSYLLTPTAYVIPHQKKYFHNVNLGLNTIHYGYADRFMLSAGLEFFSAIRRPDEGLNAAYGFINLKFNSPVQPRPNWKFAGGLMLMNSINAMNRGEGLNLGMIYGMSTYGSYKRNVSLGYGFGLGLKFPQVVKRIIFAGTQFALNDHFSLVGEAWFTRYSNSGFTNTFGQARYFYGTFIVQYQASIGYFGAGIVYANEWTETFDLNSQNFEPEITIRGTPYPLPCISFKYPF